MARPRRVLRHLPTVSRLSRPSRRPRRAPRADPSTPPHPMQQGPPSGSLRAAAPAASGGGRSVLWGHRTRSRTGR
ncbi:hypothetical protein ACFFX0_07415 [Citricoccus parietis]|uniref:Uncharacterized protein n=1 Tax=Citricoccus parietis TaxID=592307 RepID=A0ABV5FWG0_9MICC